MRWIVMKRPQPNWPWQDIVCNVLIHWGRVTHVCVGNLTIIGSDNGLSPGRRQATTWTNVGILLIRLLVTNFSNMLIEIHTFSFKKIHLKMSSGKWRPFCLVLNVLKPSLQTIEWIRNHADYWVCAIQIGGISSKVCDLGNNHSTSTKKNQLKLWINQIDNLQNKFSILW